MQGVVGSRPTSVRAVLRDAICSIEETVCHVLGLCYVCKYRTSKLACLLRVLLQKRPDIGVFASRLAPKET